MPGLEKAPDGEYLTDRLTAEAEKFIEANRDRPFFLYLAHYAPHIPLRAKPELVAKYKPGKHGEQGNPNYAAMIESIDDGVAGILKKLDDLKLTRPHHRHLHFGQRRPGDAGRTEHWPRRSTGRCAKAKATCTKAASACR